MATQRTVEAYLSLVRTNYRAYVYYVNRGFWKPGRAVSYICNRVQEFLEKPSINAFDILILSIPPQHGKSMSITEALPSWYLGRHTTKRVIEISYSESFAQKFGRKNKQKIEEFGEELFGIKLAESPNTSTEFELSNHMGGMLSRGVLSGVTGNACNLMIIDDPVKTRQEADSETYRERIWEEWQNSFKTRLAAGAKVILIMTRWHEDDLAGRMIKHEKNVNVINLPCEAEENDLLGRRVGEALAPEIGKDNKWLASFKETYSEGTRAWNALFQGRPTAQTGNMIKRHWWRYYEKSELPKLARVVISVDAAFKDEDTSDYVAIEVWGKRDANIYLIDMICDRLDFVDTVKAIEGMAGKYDYKAIYIEDKANGSAVISYLKHKKELHSIIPVNPEGGKVARVNAVSGIIEGGNVFLPKDASYTDGFVEECAAFPTGAHDDMVDAMTQALNKEYYRHADIRQEKRINREYRFVKKRRETLGRGKTEVF